jgi:hypothetical protein
MQVNPLRQIESSIYQKLMNETQLRSIIVPGGIDDTTEQFPDSIFKAGWDTISKFSLVTHTPRVVRADNCIFNVTLDSKNLTLHTRAMDFIIWAMFLLDGLQPWQEVQPLIPSFCGYRGHDYESGYSRYQLTFDTSFSWETGKEFVMTEPVTNIVYEKIDLKLWTPIANPTFSEVLSVI